jgi:hypothetical protein
MFDPVAKNFDTVHWTVNDWSQFYPDIKGEVLAPGQPEPQGKPVPINLFCDTAHATCHIT